MLPEREPDIESEGMGLSLPFLMLSLLSAAILLSLFVLATLPAVERNERSPIARKPETARVTAPTVRLNLVHSRHTVVYLVSSQAEASKLDAALLEWRMEIQALGIESQQPQRVVVVQTPEEVMHQRIIDFGILATQAPALELQVIDLRE